MADWFDDVEVYEFIGEWLPVIPELSMRDYIKAREIKKAGMDWRTLLHRQWKCSRLAIGSRCLARRASGPRAIGASASERLAR